MVKFFHSFFLFLMLLAFFGCKSSPDSRSSASSLVFSGIEAESPDALKLFFTLEVMNTVPQAGLARIESWQVEINGRAADSAFGLEYPQGPVFPLLSEGFSSFPLRLNMDVADLVSRGIAPADEYTVNLIADLAFAYDSAPSVKTRVSGAAAFPGVRPPAFSITSIAILKAELINTRFRVGLKIDNPNPFPLDLSAFNYNLFGNGRPWADGSEKNMFRVQGKSSMEGDLYLLMNFINMKRDLLDQIIYLIDVNYRFAGEVRVSTGVEYLNEFITYFDLSGYSQVFDN